MPPRSWLPAAPAAKKSRTAEATRAGQIRVGFQGELGAYSESAIRQHYGDTDVQPIPCENFEELFEVVRSGKVDRGMLPVENSLAGTIHKNFDLLLANKDVHIIGEVSIHICHCLMVQKGVKIGDVKRVLSHPVALLQCQKHISEHGFEQEVTYDTAGSAKMIADGDMRDAAAIAGSPAAERYGLEILAEDIQDDKDNFTRFLILAREPCTVEAGAPAKTTVAFTLKNGPGALVNCLNVWAMRQIDLSKIESRPINANLHHLEMGGSETRAGQMPMTPRSESRFDYLFYVDVLSSMSETKMQNAIRHLMEDAPFTRVLGTYPRELHGLIDIPSEASV